MEISSELRAKLIGLPQRLKARLRGQDHAIDRVCERLQHGELGLATAGRPRASFLFLGPTGVGKTELTLQFTRELSGPGTVVRLDMSEYQTADRLGLLLGDATVTGRIADGFDRCNGRGTLLFDEIEKAHPRVLDVLLQLLDAARVTTGRNRELNFTNWYVVLTSNLGAQRIMALRKSKFETMERLVRQEAQRDLRPEIFARISCVVVFNKLDFDTQRAIAHEMVEVECAAFSERGWEVQPTDSAIELVLQNGFSDRLGARPMRDAVELLLRNALAADLIAGAPGCGSLVTDATGLSLQLRGLDSRSINNERAPLG